MEQKIDAQLPRMPEAPAEVDVSLDKLIKYGAIEREVTPIHGFKIVLHVLSQEEREEMVVHVPASKTPEPTVQAVLEAQKVPTLAWAITELDGVKYTTVDQKIHLLKKLRKAPGTTIDLLYVEYNKLFAEQYEMLSQGIKKK